MIKITEIQIEALNVIRIQQWFHGDWVVIAEPDHQFLAFMTYISVMRLI